MDAHLRRIEKYCEDGQYLKAYKASKPLGRLTAWPGTDGLILAGRLAARLGSMRTGMAIHRMAWREDREHLNARYYYCFTKLMRFGPLCGWKWMKRFGDPQTTNPRSLADWYGLRAMTLASFRDFEPADYWINKAIETAPGEPYAYVQRSSLLLSEDRPEEALEAARLATKVLPWYRPAVESIGHILTHLNRDEEAVEFLQQACERLEAGSIRWQLAMLLQELDRKDEARVIVESMEAYYPLMDRFTRQSMAAYLAAAAYECDDRETSVHWLKHVTDKRAKYYTHMAERLSDPNRPGERKSLAVPFVLQQHDTCAPATLCALSMFWNRPADQNEVAEEICYGGTPAWRSRRWAERQGFLVREFTVDWDTTVALIDRGVPFALEIRGPDWGHLQALNGYDSVLKTFIIRDSNHRGQGESIADDLLKEQNANGPRGMILIPKDENGKKTEDLLKGIPLQDAKLFDVEYAVRLALEEHDRTTAARWIKKAKERWPEHRIVLSLEWALASYDCDLVGQLNCVSRLLKAYPENAYLTMVKASMLTDFSRRKERLELLRVKCHEKDASYIFWQQYASELLCDATSHEEAHYWIRRLIRSNQHGPAGYGLLSSVAWDAGRRDEALELKRFAACLEPTRENYAKDYFIAASNMGLQNEAIQFLKERFERFGPKSALPGVTLAWAYSNTDRTTDMFHILTEAMRNRPKDGELLLCSAEQCAGVGRFSKSEKLMKKAKAYCSEIAWLRASAQIAAMRGLPDEALLLAQRVAELEPAEPGSHELVAQLLADTQNESAVVAYLDEILKRFPYHAALRRLYVEWLGEESPRMREEAIRRLMELNEAAPEPHERLAMVFREEQRLDEALSEADTALRLDPTRPSAYVVKGMVLERQGDTAQAKTLCRKAIELSVDFDWALQYSLHLAKTPKERRDALVFIRNELTRQVTFGDGLMSFRELAMNILEEDDLLYVLRQAQMERPDLWHAWSALCMQLTAMGRHEEAVPVANEAVERFPLLPRLWLDVAAVSRAAEDTEREMEALRRALLINPSWAEAARELAEAHIRNDELVKAVSVLERALLSHPGDCVTHGTLADVLWSQGEHDQAIEHLQIAIRIAPRYEWAWRMLRQWSIEEERPEIVMEAARDLVKRRPYQSRSWLILADMLDDKEQRPQAYRALDRAIELSPQHVDAYILKSTYLADEERFDEAAAACQPETFADRIPDDLRVQAARVEAQRGEHETALTHLRQVASDDPNHMGAWRLASQVAIDMQDLDVALVAAQNLVRLAPDDPVSLSSLGEAHQMRGETDMAVEQFRKALASQPSYLFAIDSIAEIGLHTNNPEMLEEALQFGVDTALPETLLAWRIAAATFRMNQTEAFQLLDELTLIESDAPYWLDLSCRCLRRAGWNDDLTRNIRRRTTDFEYRNIAPSFAFCVIAAEHLARQPYYSDAAALIKKGLQRKQDDPTPWQWLALWSDRIFELGDYLQAAMKAAELTPDDADAIASIGDAHLQRGERTEAMQRFHQAVEMDPSAEYSIAQLFDLQLQEQDFAGAATTLKQIEGHVAPPYVMRQFTRLLAARDGWEPAVEQLKRLAQYEGEIEADLLSAADGILAIFGPETTLQLAEELAMTGNPKPAVGPVIVQLMSRQSLRRTKAFLKETESESAFWYRALAEFVYQTIQRKGLQLDHISNYWLSMLSAFPRTLGASLYISMVERDTAAIKNWLAAQLPQNFSDKLGLMYATVAARMIGDHETAAQLESDWSGDQDHRIANHSAFLACGLCAKGKWEDAAGWLIESSLERASHYNKALHLIAFTMLQINYWMPPEKRPATFKEAREFLDDQIESLGLMDIIQGYPLLRRKYFACLRRLAKTRRCPLIAFYYGLRRGSERQSSLYGD
jgi:cellulose synthase operon protein C